MTILIENLAKHDRFRQADEVDPTRPSDVLVEVLGWCTLADLDDPDYCLVTDLAETFAELNDRHDRESICLMVGEGEVIRWIDGEWQWDNGTAAPTVPVVPFPA